MLKTLFISLSQCKTFQRMTSRFRPARRIARRFVAGEALEDALAQVRSLNREGFDVTLNHLGEEVATREDAAQAADEYARILDRLQTRDLRASLSVKPSHLGLGYGEDFFCEQMKKIREQAVAFDRWLEVDMEHSSTVDATLRSFHALMNGRGKMRLALQAYLFRTAEDLEGLIAKGGSVRLVKGAYDESPDIAWKRGKDLDASYAELIRAMLRPEALDKGFYPAIATHDHRLILEAMEAAQAHDIPKDAFEFQMLLGVRRDWQWKLLAEGYRVRIYVPFGTQWYPYFMRRLGERPANLLFMARAMVGK